MAYSKQENAIVERCNKEVVRHIKNILFNKEIKDNWHETLPFVQRIINASIHSATGVSPGQLLFGDAIQLDENIVDPVQTPKGEESTVPVYEYRETLLKRQSKIIELAQLQQQSTNDKHMSTQSDEPITEFEVGEPVLVAYPATRMATRHPGKLDPTWQGPYEVSNKNGAQYETFDASTGKFKWQHIDLLKDFEYNEAEGTPQSILI